MSAQYALGRCRMVGIWSWYARDAAQCRCRGQILPALWSVFVLWGEAPPPLIRMTVPADYSCHPWISAVPADRRHCVLRVSDPLLSRLAPCTLPSPLRMQRPHEPRAAMRTTVIPATPRDNDAAACARRGNLKREMGFAPSQPLFGPLRLHPSHRLYLSPDAAAPSTRSRAVPLPPSHTFRRETPSDLTVDPTYRRSPPH